MIDLRVKASSLYSIIVEAVAYSNARAFFETELNA